MIGDAVGIHNSIFYLYSLRCLISVTLRLFLHRPDSLARQSSVSCHVLPGCSLELIGLQMLIRKDTCIVLVAMLTYLQDTFRMAGVLSGSSDTLYNAISICLKISSPRFTNQNNLSVTNY
jgi:hypothetical protein